MDVDTTPRPRCRCDADAVRATLQPTPHPRGHRSRCAGKTLGQRSRAPISYDHINVATLQQLSVSSSVRSFNDMIDPDSDRARYLQLADALRAQIASGELPPGSRLASEKTLEQETGLNRSTIRRSIDILRSEGLIVVRHPHGTFVREKGEVEVVEVTSGTIVARMPTPDERRQLSIAEGVPILIVEGHDLPYAADRTLLQVRPTQSD